MKDKKLFLRALISSLGLIAYLLLVSLVINNGNLIFGSSGSLWGPMLFLLLFVFSALVCGLLVLAKPLTLYLDGKKRESMRLIAYTGLNLFIVLLIFMLLLGLKSY